MASQWKSIPKIDAHTHVILHQRENTDLSYNPPDAMRRVMDEHRVERAIVLPINYPDYFPLTGDERAD
jgi:predicted TIM-barrel fold metal-dependent hydrolase